MNKEIEKELKKVDKEAFYKRCPGEGCGTICGFCLPDSEKKKDPEMICPFCEKSNKLSKWKKSTRGSYNGQNYIRDGSKFYGGKGLTATAV